jgi:hypothetical protein
MVNEIEHRKITRLLSAPTVLVRSLQKHLAMLDASGFEYTKIELGARFLLGTNNPSSCGPFQEVRMVPHHFPDFHGGKCIGGVLGISSFVESGELEGLMKKSKCISKGGAAKKSGFSFFQ